MKFVLAIAVTLTSLVMTDRLTYTTPDIPTSVEQNKMSMVIARTYLHEKLCSSNSVQNTKNTPVNYPGLIADLDNFDPHLARKIEDVYQSYHPTPSPPLEEVKMIYVRIVAGSLYTNFETVQQLCTSLQRPIAEATLKKLDKI